LDGIRESFVCEGGCVLGGGARRANAFRQGECTRRGPLANRGAAPASKREGIEAICGAVRSQKGARCWGHWVSINRLKGSRRIGNWQETTSRYLLASESHALSPIGHSFPR
jgi:hypothetical protein